MTALGLSSKKSHGKDPKDHKSKSKDDDAEDVLKQLEKKKEESPETCVFC